MRRRQLNPPTVRSLADMDAAAAAGPSSPPHPPQPPPPSHGGPAAAVDDDADEWLDESEWLEDVDSPLPPHVSQLPAWLATASTPTRTHDPPIAQWEPVTSPPRPPSVHSVASTHCLGTPNFSTPIPAVTHLPDAFAVTVATAPATTSSAQWTAIHEAPPSALQVPSAPDLTYSRHVSASAAGNGPGRAPVATGAVEADGLQSEMESRGHAPPTVRVSGPRDGGKPAGSVVHLGDVEEDPNMYGADVASRLVDGSKEDVTAAVTYSVAAHKGAAVQSEEEAQNNGATGISGDPVPVKRYRTAVPGTLTSDPPVISPPGIRISPPSRSTAGRDYRHSRLLDRQRKSPEGQHRPLRKFNERKVKEKEEEEKGKGSLTQQKKPQITPTTWKENLAKCKRQFPAENGAVPASAAASKPPSKSPSPLAVPPSSPSPTPAVATPAPRPPSAPPAPRPPSAQPAPRPPSAPPAPHGEGDGEDTEAYSSVFDSSSSVTPVPERAGDSGTGDAGAGPAADDAAVGETGARREAFSGSSRSSRASARSPPRSRSASLPPPRAAAAAEPRDATPPPSYRSPPAQRHRPPPSARDAVEAAPKDPPQRDEDAGKAYDAPAARAYMRMQRLKWREERAAAAAASAEASQTRQRRLEQLRQVQKQLVRASTMRRPRPSPRSKPQPPSAPILRNTWQNQGSILPVSQVSINHQKPMADRKQNLKKQPIQRPTGVLKPQLRSCAYQQTTESAMAPYLALSLQGVPSRGGETCGPPIDNSSACPRHTHTSHPVPLEHPNYMLREDPKPPPPTPVETQHRHKQRSSALAESASNTSKMAKRSRLSSPSGDLRSPFKTSSGSKSGRRSTSSTSPCQKNSSCSSPHRPISSSSKSSLFNVIEKHLDADSRKESHKSSRSTVEHSSVSEAISTSSGTNKSKRHHPIDVTSVLVNEIEKLNRYVDEMKESGFLRSSHVKPGRSRRSFEKDLKKLSKESRERKHSRRTREEEVHEISSIQLTPRRHRLTTRAPRLPSPTDIPSTHSDDHPHNKENAIPGIQNLRELMRDVAARKIQALYRGYRTRKLLSQKSSHSDNFVEHSDDESDVRKNWVNQETGIKEMAADEKEKFLLLLKSSVMQVSPEGEKQSSILDQKKEISVPQWQEAPPLSTCPYNFFTAVKRKVGIKQNLSNTVHQSPVSPRGHKSIQTIDHKEVQTVDPIPAVSKELAVQVPEDVEIPAVIAKPLSENIAVNKDRVSPEQGDQLPLDVPNASLKRSRNHKKPSAAPEDKSVFQKPKPKITLKADSDIGEEFISSGAESPQSSHSNKNMLVPESSVIRYKPSRKNSQLHSLQQISPLPHQAVVNEKCITVLPHSNGALRTENLSFTSLERDKVSEDDTETNISSIISQVASEYNYDMDNRQLSKVKRKSASVFSVPALVPPEGALSMKQTPWKVLEEVKSDLSENEEPPHSVSVASVHNDLPLSSSLKETPKNFGSPNVSSHSSVNISKISDRAVKILLGEPVFDDSTDEIVLLDMGSSNAKNKEMTEDVKKTLVTNEIPVERDFEMDDNEDNSININATEKSEKISLNGGEGGRNEIFSKAEDDNKVKSISQTSNTSASSGTSKKCSHSSICDNIRSKASKTGSLNLDAENSRSEDVHKEGSDISKSDINSGQVEQYNEVLSESERSHQRTSLVDGSEPTEQSVQPGEVLPPAALHMQFKAELQLFNSLDESCRHLERVEGLHALTMAQQSASNLAAALKTTMEGQQLAERFAKEREEFERVLKKAKHWNKSASDDSASAEKSKSSQTQAKSGKQSLKRTTSESSVAVSEEYEEESGGFETSASSSAKVVKDDSRVNYRRGTSSEQVDSLKSIQESIAAKSSTDVSTGHSFTSMSMDLEPEFSSSLRSHRLIPEDLNSGVQPPLLSVPPAPVMNFQQAEQLLQTEPILATTYFMYEQMLRHEELRAEEQASVLNMKERSLLDRARAAMALLEARKRELRAKGKEHGVPALKKKQRALVLRLQSDREELRRQRRAHAQALEERRRALAQTQTRLLHLQMARHTSVSATVPPATPRSMGSPRRRESGDTQSRHSSAAAKSSSNAASISTEVPPTRQSVSARSSAAVTASGLEVASHTSHASSVSTSSVKSVAHTQSLEDKILSYLKTLDTSKRRLTEHQKSMLASSLEELLQAKKKQDNGAQTNASANAATPNLFQDRGTSPVVVLEKVSSTDAPISNVSVTGNDEDSVLSAYDKSPHPSNSSVPEEVHTRASDSSSQDSKPPVEHITEASLVETNSQMPTQVSGSSEEIVEEVSVESKRGLAKPGPRMAGQNRRHSADLFLRSISPLPPLPPSTTHKRRYSSGSDESIIYSQTETPSEQSDLEGRVSALLEQLRRRRLEADKLRREHKRTHRERLRAKEQSLLKQIQAYDEYIQKTREEIQKELDSSSVPSASFSKPKIKQPCNASRTRDRLSLPADITHEISLDDTRGKNVKEKILSLSEKLPSEVLDDISKGSQFSHTISENLSVDTGSVDDNTKSHGEATLPDEVSIILEDGAADESSISSFVSETGLSTAISVSSEKDSAIKDPDSHLESSAKIAVVEQSFKNLVSTDLIENEDIQESATVPVEDTASESPEKVISQITDALLTSGDDISKTPDIQEHEIDDEKIIGAGDEKSSTDSSDEKSSITVIDEKVAQVTEEIPSEISEKYQENSHSEELSNKINLNSLVTPDGDEKLQPDGKIDSIEKSSKFDDYSQSFEDVKSIPKTDSDEMGEKQFSPTSKSLSEKKSEKEINQKEEGSLEVSSLASVIAEEIEEENQLNADEEEHVTLSSGDASESQTTPTDIIKVFISEKGSKSPQETDQLHNAGAEEDSIRLEDKDVSEKALSEIQNVSEGSLEFEDKKIYSKESSEKIEQQVRDSKERTCNIVDKITEDIFRSLLKDMLGSDFGKKKALSRATELSPLDQSLEEEKKENSPKSSDVTNQSVDEYLDSAFENFYKIETEDETFVSENTVRERRESDAETKLNLTFDLLNEEMNSATDTILNILEKKKSFVDEDQPETGHLTSPESPMHDIRRRVSEILAETSLNSSTRESPRMQDLLTTTYDVSSSPSPEELIENHGLPASRLFGADSADDFWEFSTGPDKEAELVGAEGGAGSLAGGGGGDLWFEDALLPSAGVGAGGGAGAAAAAAAAATVEDEAEMLRLQQLHIEREIQQLQAAQEQVPFFYVREIPNKPPPPYTPPGQARLAAALQTSGAAGDGGRPGARPPPPPPPPPPLTGAPRIDQATLLLEEATTALAAAAAEGKPLEEVQMPEEFGADPDFDKLAASRGASAAAASRNRRAYSAFLFDLARAAVREEWAAHAPAPALAQRCPPWRWPATAPPRPRIPGAPSAAAAVQRARRALDWARGGPGGPGSGGLADGSARGAGAGALALRWSRRRRDRVDEVLTREARDEEPSWTRYDEEAACLKVEVADQLLAVLLDETANAIQSVLDKREERKTQEEDKNSHR